MTNLIRIIKSGFLLFWRSKWLSAATILVMSLAIFMITSLLFVNVLADSLLHSLQDKIDISIYFELGAKEDEILSIRKDLSKIKEIKSIDYVSRQEALEKFKEKHKDNAILMQSLDELDSNPLRATLNIKTKDPSQYASVTNLIQNAKYNNLIKKINYQQNKEIIAKFSSFSGLVKKVGLILSGILIIVAILVAFNTVRLALFNMKDEISVMRLVGADNWHIRAPFIVEGIIHGLIAVLVALLIIYPVLIWLSPKITSILPGSDLLYWFKLNLWQVLLFQVVLGAGLGAISSSIVIRKYLKV